MIRVAGAGGFAQAPAERAGASLGGYRRRLSLIAPGWVPRLFVKLL